MTTTQATDNAPTYGNWARPASAGLGKLGTLGTAAGLGLLMITAIVMMVDLFAGLAVLFVGVLILAPLAWRNRNHQTGWEVLGNRIGWHVTRAQKQDTFRSGPMTRLGRFALPGLGASIELHDAVDSTGEAYTLLAHPGPGHITAVLRSEPEGMHLVDQTDIDKRVAAFGAWLAALGTDRDLVGVSISITTAPDSGHTLREAIASQISSDAHELARTVLEEVANSYPETASTLSCEIAITWRRTKPGTSKRRSIDEMAVEVGRRLPAIRNDLAHTGAGVAMNLRHHELAAIVRTSFDPDVSPVVDAMAEPENEIHWNDAGPVSADERVSTYHHDSGVSRSWYMAEAPRGEVLSSCLASFLAPHESIARKRVTLVYRPHDPAAAAARVDKAVRDATFNTGAKRRAQARDHIAMEAASQAAREEARGAGLVRFAMIVTATVHEGEDIEAASSAVEHAANASRIRLRVARRQQAVAFLASLPLGIHLPHHSRIPDELRETSR